MVLLEVSHLSEGLDVLIVGMLVVFLVLLILFLFIFNLKAISEFFSGTSKSASATVDTPKQSKELTGQENAAISMAIYLYLEEQHDFESGVLTIKSVKKAYSPWSSKIYGMNYSTKR